jgi:hypothetical protein
MLGDDSCFTEWTLIAPEGHDARAIQGWLGHRSITSMAAYCDRGHVMAALRALAWNRSYSF